MKNQGVLLNGNATRSPSTPFFSIIIATYNRAHLITRAVNSLFSQTEHDWEAIVVDDGSTDNTDFLVHHHFSDDKRFKYLRRDHKGEARSKNAGICLSAGRYISFLDSDDEYNICHLESRKNILMRNPLVKFLYGGFEVLGNQSVPDRFNPLKSINLNDCVIGGTFFIERNLMITLKGFKNIPYGTDADLYDRITGTGVESMEVSMPTYIYHRESEDSITNRLLTGLKPYTDLRGISHA